MAEHVLTDETPRVDCEAEGRVVKVETDDAQCWLCEEPVIKRHCKIVCQRCGFMRDCSDP